MGWYGVFKGMEALDNAITNGKGIVRARENLLSELSFRNNPNSPSAAFELALNAFKGRHGRAPRGVSEGGRNYLTVSPAHSEGE